jgi:murein DD-endopeptidase / murein LD-carboxypeptidase
VREVAVDAARALAGVPFRPQGRDLTGLDCLGVALLAASAAGVSVALPPFPMRGTRLADARNLLLSWGCTECPATAAAPGDLLLRSVGPRQVHLAVRTGTGLVEAHAALRRVVERPLAPGETWDSGWRLPGGSD